MLVEQRPELARSAEAISELNAKNRFTKEKFQIPKAKAAEKVKPAPRARPVPVRANRARP